MKRLLIFVLILTLVVSCRKESIDFYAPSEEEQLVASSTAAILMENTSLLDGSRDNIIDKASCLTVIFPVEVEIDDETIVINSLEDLDLLEDLLDEKNDDDYDLIYPFQVLTSDFNIVTIVNEDQLEDYIESCPQDGSDDDIECIDFVYPVTFLSFNIATESIDTYNIFTDNDMFDFLSSLTPADVVSIQFPLVLKTSDEETLTVNNIQELQSTLAAYEDFCNEDDDLDFRDDDCYGCTPDNLLDILTQCDYWEVDKLERYDYDYDDYYEGYSFQFSRDGKITVDYDGELYYGTFETSGQDNDLIVTINIPEMPYCNNNWRLHKIENSYGETKINFRKGENDRMRYESECN
ncbi:hypothetical protein [Aegicerativicinus sediminis]|uniref:hypothetical protein n=1 Tax=Aegicerativicinus sediminis TaxID=2893202 RepID=UPI001E3F1463|nr:hypothetical protein [Aegicerativicinus sediminis]